MANTCPADTAASKTKQAFALRFPAFGPDGYALRPVCVAPQRAFRAARPVSVGLAHPLWAYAHERRPFFSRAQTFFIVSANLFSRDEKPPPPNVVAAKGNAAQLLAGACRLSFARASIGWAAVVAL